MVVRQGGEKEAPKELRSAGLEDIRFGCRDDKRRKKCLLRKAKSITAASQMERFIYLSLQDFALCYRRAFEGLGQLDPCPEDLGGSRGSFTSSPPLTFLQDPYVASGEYEKDLAAEDGVSTDKYRRLVYDPAFARGKILHPPIRAWDDSFQGFLRLLRSTLVHYRSQELDSDPPAFWVLVFWSLCYRSCGREEFFLDHFHGRLPLPHAPEIDLMTAKLEAHKGFTNRYRVQGAERTKAILSAFLRMTLAFEEFGCWECLGVDYLTPRLLHEKLQIELKFVRKFMAWQVSRISVQEQICSPLPHTM